MKKVPRAITASIVTSALFAAASSALAATTYQVTTLDQSGYSSATAMNANGLIAGQESQIPAFWNASNQLVLLPQFPSGFDGTAYDINASGQIVYQDLGESFLWDNGVNTRLNFAPFAINDAGQIAGGDGSGAVIVTNGVVTQLPGNGYSVGYSINNLGHVAGVSGGTAALWIDGNRVDLGRLSGATYSSANGINEHDQVVGESGGRPFLWQNGVLSELPMLEGGSRAVALNINNNGIVVGYAQKNTPRGPRSYFVTWQNGVINDLSLVLPSATGCTGVAINDNGQIAANCGGVQRITPTTPGADVGVAIYSTTKTDARGDIETGQAVNYTIEVGNTGSFNASSVRVNYAIPAGMTFISATPSQGSCSNSGTLVCSMGNLAVGGRATIQLTVMPTITGTIESAVQIAMNEADVNSINNSSTYRVRIVELISDISVFMSGPSSVSRNSNVTYKIDVTNNGLANSAGVTMTDTLPSGMRFVSVSTTQGSCSGTTTITCNLGAMSYQAKASITIVAQARTKGTFTNTARVSSLTKDPYTYNDSYKVTTTVK